MDSRAATAALAAARFDPIAIDQLAERQVLWARALIAKGASESSIRAAIDAIASWAQQAKPMRLQAQDIGSLEAAARTRPHDLSLDNAISRYWLRELARERGDIPSDRTMLFRINPRTGSWQCVGCYASRGPSEQPSRAFPPASVAVRKALADAPNDATALFQAALLWMFVQDSGGPPDAVNPEVEDFARRAAAQVGPEASAARIYLLVHDSAVARLRQQAGVLRGRKAIGSKVIVRGFDSEGHPDPDRNVYQPIFRAATPQEIAAAQELDRKAAALEAEQSGELDAALQAGRANSDCIRMLASRPIDLAGNWQQQREEQERVLRYAILLDPTDWTLHFARAANFSGMHQRALELASAEAQAVLRNNRDGDFVYIFDQEWDKLRADAFIPYVFALQAVRRDPANPFAHQRLAMAMQDLIRHRINGVPIMPQAFQQAVLEMKLVRYLAQRHLQHPEDWRDASTRQSTLELLEWVNKQIASIPAKPPEE